MRNAVAFANNDVVTIAWSYGTKPEGCMGFALYRIDTKGEETALPSHAVFPDGTIKDGQTTAQFPIQKFYWKDVYARLVGDKTGDYTFRYKVVPLEGLPNALKAMASLPILTTNEVEVSGVCSPSLTAIFNRGLISTQHVSDALKGNVNTTSLLAAIKVPGNQLRKDLAGDILGTLTGFVARAKTSGSIYAALYELTDVELVQSLVGIRTKLNIVLANIVAKPKPGGSEETAGENDDSEAKLKATAGVAAVQRTAEWTYCSQQVPHLCGRQRSAESGADRLVQLDRYRPMRADEQLDRHSRTSWWRHGTWRIGRSCRRTRPAHEAGSPFQDTALRAFNSTGKNLNLDKGSDDASTLTSYFSPNTPKHAQQDQRKIGGLSG